MAETINEKQLMKDIEAKDEVLSVKQDVDNDASMRIGGYSNFAGYDTLRDFYEGDQWSYNKPGKRVQRTFNYCYPIVEKYAAYLMGTTPTVNVPPADMAEAELERADNIEKLLKKIWLDNNMETKLEQGARVGSMLGDTVYKVFYDTSEKKIRILNIDDPGAFRPIWSSNSYDEMDAAIVVYDISARKAAKKFGKVLKANGGYGDIMDVALQRNAEGNDSLSSMEPQTTVPMVTVVDYWDKEKNVILVAGIVVQNKPNPYGFIPFVHIPNIKLPRRPWGMSDIEQILDIQDEYNQRVCDEADIIQAEAFPKYVAVNANVDPKTIKAGVSQIIPVGENGDFKRIQNFTQIWPMKDYHERLIKSIHDISGVPPVAFGGQQALPGSGLAMSVQFQSMLDRIKSKQNNWSIGLKRLNWMILKLAEKYLEAEDLIRGYYNCEIIWPDVKPKDMIQFTTNELNKLNAGVQSFETTMENLSLSPQDEKAMMSTERSNPEVDPKGAAQVLQVQGQAQSLQMQAQQAQMMQQPQGAPAESGGLAAANAPQPSLSEGMNQPGTMPMTQEGMGQNMTQPGGQMGGFGG